MNKYPQYINRQVIETLGNDVVVTLSKGILTVCALNQFGAEEQVYCHPITVDRASLGPVFAKYGKQVEATVLHELYSSALWKQIGNFSNHLHGRTAELLNELVWFLPGATPSNVCTIAYRLNHETLAFMAEVGVELMAKNGDRAAAYHALVKENPLAVSDVNFITVSQPDGVTLTGLYAIYDILFDVLIPE